MPTNRKATVVVVMLFCGAACAGMILKSTTPGPARTNSADQPGEKEEITKLKMQPAADIAAWRGIVFGTNWCLIEDSILFRAEYNPWLESGLQACARRTESLTFGGIPVEMIMYAIDGNTIIGVRMTFAMENYAAILAKCRASLGPTGTPDDLLLWEGRNLSVFLCKYHTPTSGLMDAFSTRSMKAFIKKTKNESQREFQ